MQFSFPSLFLALIAAYIIYKAISLVRNYFIAARTGFPVFVSPALSHNFSWIVLGPVFRPLFEKWLPSWIYDRLDVEIHGWEFRRKNAMHKRFGKTFVVATPDNISLWTTDPDIANQILVRRKDFLQAPISAIIMNLLGPNVLTANGEDWQRQRRIVAPNLNERISASVWSEACEQAHSMLDYLLSHSDDNDKTVDGLRTIAINVLGHSGYGQSRTWTPEPYGPGGDEAKTKEEISYLDGIYLVAVQLLEAAFVPPIILRLPFMPQTLQLLGKVLPELPRKTKELLNEERNPVSAPNSEARSNFLSMMVRLSDQEGKGEANGVPGNGIGKKSLSLTEQEIQGNLFIFSAAGFDTTANTMGYAVTLLAAYPEWQDWIKEEIKSLELSPDAESWEYEEAFPKCQRVLAVMFETLRLFTPVPHTTRSVYTPQTLTSSAGSHYLQSPMMVYVSTQSMHYSSDLWGSDVHSFRPSRWIDSAGKLITPPKGTFLPWSGGPRQCPGMKMSQVEFAATFATLFKGASCETVKMASQTDKDVRERLIKLMDNSQPKLTLQMVEPKEVKLRWIRDG